MARLPLKNEKGFFEIRFESIGGLGANLAGQMLAEAGVLGDGFNGVNFSSYGSEKKGTPVESFIRFADHATAINDHSPVKKPHVIAVFHEALHKTIPVTDGLHTDGIILVNTTKGFAEVREMLKLTHGRIATVDALSISIEEKTRINTAMLGALYRVLEFLNPDHMRNVIRKTFAGKSPELIAANLKTFERGYHEVKLEPEGEIESGYKHGKPVPILKTQNGYDTMPIGGIITTPANSLEKDLSSSRTGFLPELDLEKCISCAKCDLVCPDICFVWEQKEDKRGRPLMFLKGIDYQYCKGCLKCIEVCPTDALKAIRETDGYAEKYRTPKQDPVWMEEVY